MIWAVIRKELQEIRRTKLVLYTMTVTPTLFLVMLWFTLGPICDGVAKARDAADARDQYALGRGAAPIAERIAAFLQGVIAGYPAQPVELHHVLHAGEYAALENHLRLGTQKDLGVLVLGLTALSRRQTAVWQTNETLFLHAIAVTVNNLLAHGNLGTFYGMQGQWDKAERHLNEVLRRRPMDGGARHSLGNVYLRQGRKPEALAEYRLAAQDNKQWEAMNNVAWLLATAPDGVEHAGESLDWAERALRAAPESDLASVWNTLAASRANAGDFPGAIEAAEKALELARASGDHTLAEWVRSRMKLFERKQPYRE